MARTPPQYKPTQREEEAITKVRRCIEEAKRWHNTFARKVERRYEAWRGMLPSDAELSTGWRSQLHPPYLINIVEGMLASLEEENPVWTVFPRAVPGMAIEDAIETTANAEMSSYLLAHQMRVDNFADKAGPLAHQDLIAGLTVGKIFWLKKTIKRKYWDEDQETIYDEAGGTLDIAARLNRYAEDDFVVRDDPTLEVRDVRDFLYPESAKDIETAPWLIDRTFVTYDTLLRMEALGVYKNVKYVKETRFDESPATTQPERGREQRLRNVDRTRGLVEILELWTNDSVITVANGSVLLRHQQNPFDHGRKPFIVCSAIPDLFQIPGVSVIEGLAQMQEMLWTLQNTRLDATRIAASVITMVRGDVEDPEQYEWAPEAQWIVPDPHAVNTVDMSSVIAAAQATLQSEGLARGDIQNVMGGLPFTGSSQSQSLPTDTATGVSIVTNIAQAILARRKGMYQRMYGKAGQMFLELDQQFIQDDRLVEVLGDGGARSYLQMGWRDVQGIFDVELEVTGESMLRQERRAENQALLTMALQGAQVSAMSGAKLNIRRFWERLLDSYGIVDKATFFEQVDQMAQQAQQAQQQGQGTPGTPQTAQSAQEGMNGSGSLPTNGATNEALAAGPTAPSSPVSMSGGNMLQQSLARVGAGRSA